MLVAAYAWYGLAVTIVVMLAIAAAILMFERRRARQIEHDLGERSGRPPS